MRPFALLALLLLASCAGASDNRLAAHPPGLDIADVALANGAPDTALHVADQTLSTDPGNVAALVRKAEAETELGQRSAAMASFRQALQAEPASKPAMLGLGRLELQQDPSAAAPIFARIVAMEPRNVPALIDQGIANDLLGKHAVAQDCYRRALAINPDQRAAQANLGLSLALSGEASRAVDLLRPLAAGTDVSPRMRQDFAAALAMDGRNDEATSVLRTDMNPAQTEQAVAAYRALLASS